MTKRTLMEALKGNKKEALGAVVFLGLSAAAGLLIKTISNATIKGETILEQELEETEEEFTEVEEQEPEETEPENEDDK